MGSIRGARAGDCANRCSRGSRTPVSSSRDCNNNKFIYSATKSHFFFEEDMRLTGMNENSDI